jgi:cell wall-associated NlpC family hydrolase
VSRYRYRRDRGAVTAAGAGLVLAAVVLAAGQHQGTAGAAAPGRGAATAIAFARAQLGQPYLWGGNGPGGWDCSGLVTAAWAAAGVTIPRTSQAEWLAGPRVSAAAPGELVFFAGGDGTATAPGHVGLVVDPARHLMIEAYAAGFAVRYSTFGLPGSPPGDQDPVGFTRPGAS